MRFFLILLLVSGCGSDDAANQEKIEMKSSDNKTKSMPQSMYLERLKELPECNSEIKSTLAYVAEQDQFYYCNINWLQVSVNGSDGLDGVDGKNGIDGKDGENGEDGVDGADMKQLYIFDSNGEKLGIPHRDAGDNLFLMHTDSGFQIELISLAAGIKSSSAQSTAGMYTLHYSEPDCMGDPYVVFLKLWQHESQFMYALPGKLQTANYQSRDPYNDVCENVSGTVNNVYETRQLNYSLPLRLQYD